MLKSRQYPCKVVDSRIQGTTACLFEGACSLSPVCWQKHMKFQSCQSKYHKTWQTIFMNIVQTGQLINCSVRAVKTADRCSRNECPLKTLSRQRQPSNSIHSTQSQIQKTTWSAVPVAPTSPLNMQHGSHNLRYHSLVVAMSSKHDRRKMAKRPLGAEYYTHSRPLTLLELEACANRYQSFGLPPGFINNGDELAGSPQTKDLPATSMANNGGKVLIQLRLEGIISVVIGFSFCSSWFFNKENKYQTSVQ